MIIRYFDNEADAINRILDADGYRFTIKGNLSKVQLEMWLNTVANRLEADNIIASQDDIAEVLYIKQSEKIRNDNKRTQLQKQEGVIINFWDYIKEIDVLIIYILLENVDPEDRAYNLEPLLLDCETIGSLFDDTGVYRGSSKTADEYVVI